MKHILIICFFLTLSSPVLPQHDQVSVRVLRDTLIVLNTAAWENCAARFSIETEIEDTEIRVIETDTVALKALCMCSFDLSATVTGLAPGRYTVIVYRNYLRRYSYPEDLMVEIGRRDVEIIDGAAHPVAGSMTQSPCYNTSEIGRSSPPVPRPELTVFPNPLRSGSAIPVARFTVALEGWILLEVYDPLGRRIATVSREILPAGNHERQIDGAHFRNDGIYFIVLTTGIARAVAPVVHLSPARVH